MLLFNCKVIEFIYNVWLGWMTERMDDGGPYWGCERMVDRGPYWGCETMDDEAHG